MGWVIDGHIHDLTGVSAGVSVEFPAGNAWFCSD